MYALFPNIWRAFLLSSFHALFGNFRRAMKKITIKWRVFGKEILNKIIYDTCHSMILWRIVLVKFRRECTLPPHPLFFQDQGNHLEWLISMGSPCFSNHPLSCSLTHKTKKIPHVYKNKYIRKIHSLPIKNSRTFAYFKLQ